MGQPDALVSHLHDARGNRGRGNHLARGPARVVPMAEILILPVHVSPDRGRREGGPVAKVYDLNAERFRRQNAALDLFDAWWAYWRIWLG